MKKLITILLIVTFGLVLTACNGEEPTEETIDQNTLETALETLELPEETDTDLDLIDAVDGFTIDWTSDDSDVLKPNGRITQPPSDRGNQTVALTATITHDDIEANRTFDITVLALSPLKEALLEISLPEITKKSIELPERQGDYTITWESDEPSYLNQRGQVARPRYEVGDQTVTLTATASDRDGRNSEQKTFEVVITAYSKEETEEAMAAALEQLELPENLDEDLKLEQYLRDFSPVWSFDDTTYIDEDGQLQRPSSDIGDQSLTLTVRLQEGDIEKEKTFEMTILAYSEAEETAMVLFEDALDTLDFVGATISEDLTLPNNVDDIRIEWRSLRPGIIHNDGTLRPTLSSQADKPVPLEATMTYQDVTMTYTIDVYVSEILEQSITSSKSMPFRNLADEYLLSNTTIEVFYTNTNGLPYVDVEQFLTLLDGGSKTGAIDFDMIDIDIDQDIMYLQVFVTSVDEDGEMDDAFVEDTTYIFEINFSKNTATVNRYGFFSSFQESTQTDFGSGLEVVDYEVTYFEPVMFDFNDYRLELFIKDDQYLMPLHLANLFFSGSMFDVYYNGDGLYGIDTYQVYPMQDSIRNVLLNSSYNDETMSEDFLLGVYDYLAFSFDYYFGLREDKGVDSYYNFFNFDTLTDPNNHYDALFTTVYRLDDLHSSFGSAGMYNPEFDRSLSLDDLGSRTKRFYETYWDLEDLGTCDRDDVEYYDDGRVARVPLHGFNADTPDEFKAMLDAILEKGGVEDVIVDLSCNTGGIIGGMIQVLGYITDDAIPYHSRNAGDQSTATVWYTSEYEAYDFEWHFMVSPITYSAGNSMAQIVKEMDLGTLMGSQTQGGASSVTANILPSGAIIFMSSPNVLTNEDYESLEYGVRPTVSLPWYQLESPTRILRAIESDD